MILIYIFLSVLTAWSTYLLIKMPSVTPTRASASFSLVGFLVLYVIDCFFKFDVETFSLLIFGASFVGMCSHKIFRSLEVIIGAVLYSILFYNIDPHVYGVGGALGFSAFVSVVVTRVLLRSSVYRDT